MSAAVDTIRNAGRVPAGSGQASDGSGLSPESLENFNDFIEASKVGDVGTMTFLLPKLLTEMKVNISRLKAEIPELYEILNENQVELLFEQSEKNLEILKNQDSGDSGRLISKILSAFTLIASALLLIVAPSPITAAFFVTSVVLTVDSAVAEITGNSSIVEKVTQGLVKLMDKLDALDSMPDWAKSLISTVVTLTAIVGAAFLAAKGGAAALNGMGTNVLAGLGAQTGGMISQQSLARFAQVSTAVTEVAQVGSSVTAGYFDFRVQTASADKNVLQAGIDRIGVDLNKLVDHLGDLSKDARRLDQFFA